jgi:phospholipid/cholesterol/gamma-HCH transport system substrate-binding protein
MTGRTTLRWAAPALALAMVLSACTLPGRVEGPVQLVATFDDVGDLVPGHSVQVADVRVGSITRIELTEDHRAEVTMRIKDGLELPADSEAILRTTSLLGEKFIELRPPAEGGAAGHAVLRDGDVLDVTREAPELEFVAEQAARVLAGVVVNDLAVLIDTGATAFGGRGADLGALIDDLAAISSVLADQTGDIVRIIDGLDRTSARLADGSGDLDRLFVTLADATDVLAENRDQALATLDDLTRLARVQNEEVFGPYRAAMDQQIRQLSTVLDIVARHRAEVSTLLVWLERFAEGGHKAIPEDFAQVYAWFSVAPIEGAAP